MTELQHWKSISEQVTKIALPILPHIRSNKLRSEIISSLFETQAGVYFNSISIPVQVCESDRDPDLIFTDTNRPLEIKVTSTKKYQSKKFKWMGGKYSKRTSDFVFVAWTYQPATTGLFGIEPETIKYFIAKAFVNENEWKIIDNGNNNYYATVYTSEQLLKTNYEIILGEYSNNVMMLV